MQKIRHDDIVNYLKLIFVFLFLSILGVGVFSYCMNRDIETNTADKLERNITKQSAQFCTTLESHYHYLEGLASYIGASADLFSNRNMQLISSVCEAGSCERISIIDTAGISHYDNGAISDVSERRYFNEAISGSRTLSDPLTSKVDNQIRVVLGVPIYDSGDSDGEIIGVLGASYNMSGLSHMIFNDYYDSSGYFMMVTKGGKIIFEDDQTTEGILEQGTDFSSFYGEREFYGDVSLQQVIADFEAQEAGQATFQEDGESYYLVYKPLEMNDWMMCYCIPVSKAQEEYRFIGRYEIALAIYMVLIVLALLSWVVYQNSKRLRAIRKAARTDALTGVRNKKDTEEKIQEWLEGGECQGLQAFLMIDIDNFKQVNDSCGHAVGDEVLCQLGEILRTSFRNGDIAGRVGGDEFVVLMKNVRSRNDALSRAKILLGHMHGIRSDGLGELEITGSMGIAFYPEDGEGFSELYQCADRALYITKGKGRNGVTVYEKTLTLTTRGEAACD